MALLAPVAERMAVSFGGLAGLEVVEDGVLAVLVFGAEAGAARGAAEGAVVEDVAALLGDAVDPVAADLGGEREHAAEDFAERSAVVLRDPAGELEEFGREERGVVEEALDFFYFDWFRISGGCGWVVMQRDDDAEEPLAGEGDEDACADFGGKVAERVGEGAVERDRQRDVGVKGHVVRVSSVIVRNGFASGKPASQRRDVGHPGK